MSDVASPALTARAAELRTAGATLLPGLIDVELIEAMRAAFEPLLAKRVEEVGAEGNRGPARHYITLPLEGPFADPEVIDNDTILALAADAVGEDGRLGEYASDTPLAGSVHQAVHRDRDALFPELSTPTPAFQIAVNIPLVDVTPQNGPVEVASGTHLLSNVEALRAVGAGEIALTPLPMRRGDVLVRDVRHLHRGTPNTSGAPRPMLVLGFQRDWLARGDVGVEAPRAVWDGLSPRARRWLRGATIVDRSRAASARDEQTILPPPTREGARRPPHARPSREISA